MAYGRKVEISAICPDGETIHITGIDADFSCVRDNEREPNEADLTLWGLTAQTHNSIAQSGSLLTVTAGYEDEGTFTLFQGELISAINVKPGEVYGLQMKLYETLIPYRASITSRTFRTGQSLKDAVSLVASDMGIGLQISPGAAALTLSKNVSGVALSKDVLTSLCKPLNVTWTIQYQTLVITTGEALFNNAALFAPDCGLLGVPRPKLYSPKRNRKHSQTGHKTNVKTYDWPPKNSQADYTKGARRQMGAIEAVAWDSLLRGGIDIGEQVELSSPSMGEGWQLVVTHISHRFSTRDRQAWRSSWEGVIA